MDKENEGCKQKMIAVREGGKREGAVFFQPPFPPLHSVEIVGDCELRRE